MVGGIISLFPALLGLFRPGRPSTRYTIAVAQMLMGALLIHLTGGRLETHFHVFGSLAFLAFYRDWRVLVPATIVVALDHLLRGAFWPQSVYGVEGVETTDQLSQLLAIGCEYAQGFYFSKPVSAVAAEALIHAEPWRLQELCTASRR